MLVPDSGRDGAGVVVPPATGVLVPDGVDVAHVQSVAFKQLGFLQTPPETHTILFAQSELLVQLSPQDSGIAGVGVGVGVELEQIQFSSVVQLVFLHTPAVASQDIPLGQSVSRLQESPQDGGAVGVGVGLLELLAVGVGVGELTSVVKLKLTKHAFPLSHLFLLTFHLHSEA